MKTFTAQRNYGSKETISYDLPDDIADEIESIKSIAESKGLKHEFIKILGNLCIGVSPQKGNVIILVLETTDGILTAKLIRRIHDPIKKSSTLEESTNMTVKECIAAMKEEIN